FLNVLRKEKRMRALAGQSRSDDWIPLDQPMPSRSMRFARPRPWSAIPQIGAFPRSEPNMLGSGGKSYAGGPGLSTLCNEAVFAGFRCCRARFYWGFGASKVVGKIF